MILNVNSIHRGKYVKENGSRLTVQIQATSYENCKLFDRYHGTRLLENGIDV